MTEQKSHSLIPASGGVFQDLGLRIKLILKLMGDRRVSPFLKLLPFGSLMYLVFPELILGPILATPLDDAFVIWLATYLFVELCPDEIVTEHMKKLRSALPSDGSSYIPPEDVIDGEFSEEKGAENNPPGN
ncbi:MAG: hypothetical protein IT308_08155 [Anaerolineaceae bacterium]|nr:hypothetical protein [Anaerolineaceae bacterium]